MGNPFKKIQDNKDKEFIYRNTGKRPKRRCPVCHRFTVWIRNENSKEGKCVFCGLAEMKKEKEKQKNEEAIATFRRLKSNVQDKNNGSEEEEKQDEQ